MSHISLHAHVGHALVCPQPAVYAIFAVGLLSIPSFFILYRKALYSRLSSVAACFRFQWAAVRAARMASVSSRCLLFWTRSRIDAPCTCSLGTRAGADSRGSCCEVSER